MFTRPPEVYRDESSASLIWVNIALALGFLVFAITAMRIAPEWAQTYLVQEPFGAMEMTGVIFPVLTIFLCLRMLTKHTVRQDKLLFLAIVLMAAGCFYIAGEEISWGQWFFKWGTPEFWAEFNDQKETNIHNISDWFDQKPRALLMIGIGVSTIIVPWLALKRPNLLPEQFDIFYPPLWMVPIGVAVIASDLFLHFKMPIFTTEIERLRPGEIQEVFIFWFLLAYAVMLTKRVSQSETNR